MDLYKAGQNLLGFWDVSWNDIGVCNGTKLLPKWLLMWWSSRWTRRYPSMMGPVVQSNDRAWAGCCWGSLLWATMGGTRLQHPKQTNSGGIGGSRSCSCLPVVWNGLVCCQWMHFTLTRVAGLHFSWGFFSWVLITFDYNSDLFWGCHEPCIMC